MPRFTARVPRRLTATLILATLLLAAGAGDDARPTLQAQDSPEDDPMPAERIRAPELKGGLSWLNTDQPVTLAGLRGKIVLLDFWTYC